MEHISLGSGPISEDCAQLGQDGYKTQAMRECRAYKGQLERLYRQSHDGAELPCWVVTKGCQHDYGTYYEVYAQYDDETQEAAMWLEAHLPEEWDVEAKKELGL